MLRLLAHLLTAKDGAMVKGIDYLSRAYHCPGVQFHLIDAVAKSWLLSHITQPRWILYEHWSRKFLSHLHFFDVFNAHSLFLLLIGTGLTAAPLISSFYFICRWGPGQTEWNQSNLLNFICIEWQEVCKRLIFVSPLVIFLQLVVHSQIP